MTTAAETTPLQSDPRCVMPDHSCFGHRHVKRANVIGCNVCTEALADDVCMTYTYTLQTDSTPKDRTRTWGDVATFPSLDALFASEDAARACMAHLDSYDRRELAAEIKSYDIGHVFADVRIVRR